MNFDLPTCKLKHKEESETEKEKREEIKGKKKGKSTEKDGYDVNVQEEPQRIAAAVFLRTITTRKVLFCAFNLLCFKHFCVVVLHLYPNWHVKDLAMTSNHIYPKKGILSIVFWMVTQGTSK